MIFRYIEKQPGKFVGDTACEKLPVEICGAGCAYEEGAEECHDKTIASLVDVPEEVLYYQYVFPLYLIIIKKKVFIYIYLYILRCVTLTPRRPVNWRPSWCRS